MGKPGNGDMSVFPHYTARLEESPLTLGCMAQAQELHDADLPMRLIALSAEQLLRVQALRQARQVLATVKPPVSELSLSSVYDLIAVARYILDGADPLTEDDEDDAGDLMDLDSVAAGEGRLTASGTSMDAP